MSFFAKITFNGEIRRFTVADGSFDSLVASCRSLFGLPQDTELELVHINRREGSKLPVASAAQLSQALALRGGKMLPLSLETKKAASNLPEAPLATAKPARPQRLGRRIPRDSNAPAADSSALVVAAPTMAALGTAPVLSTGPARPARRHGPRRPAVSAEPTAPQIEAPNAAPSEPAHIVAVAAIPALSTESARPGRRHPRPPRAVASVAPAVSPALPEPHSNAAVASTTDWKAQRLVLREKIAQAKAEVRASVARLHALLHEARALRPQKTGDVAQKARRQLSPHRKMRLAAIRRARKAAEAQPIVAH